MESKASTGKYNLNISTRMPGNRQNKRGIYSFTEVSSLTDQVSMNTDGSTNTCRSVEWQGSKVTMVAVAQPSWCEDCAVVSWKSEERQLETPSCWRFTDCLHFIVCWSPVSPVCFTCVQLLYHFFSITLKFPRWPEHHHSARLVAWRWIRQWHIVLVNGLGNQDVFKRLRKTFMTPPTHYRTTVAHRQSIHCCCCFF